MKGKKIFKTLGIILLIWIGIYSVNKEISNHLDKKITAMVDIENTTNIMNSRLPMQIEEGLICYKMQYLKNENILESYYKFTEIEKKEIDNETILIWKNKSKIDKVSLAKHDPNNAPFVILGITFICVYEDKNGEEIYKITITPAEYK
jgi:hypothetical protein